MTESSPVSHFQPEEGAVLGGCGHPISNTIAKIVDIETGDALGPNEDGELLVAGPQVMKGYDEKYIYIINQFDIKKLSIFILHRYYKNEKATNKTIIDGWLHTGDIARYNEDGQFFIVDRLKELIKVKGLQVF